MRAATHPARDNDEIEVARDYLMVRQAPRRDNVNSALRIRFDCRISEALARRLRARPVGRAAARSDSPGH